jgi:hypothetical protein
MELRISKVATSIVKKAGYKALLKCILFLYKILRNADIGYIPMAVNHKATGLHSHWTRLLDADYSRTDP